MELGSALCVAAEESERGPPRGVARRASEPTEESSAYAPSVGHYFYTRISYPFGLNIGQVSLLTRSA